MKLHPPSRQPQPKSGHSTGCGTIVSEPHDDQLGRCDVVMGKAGPVSLLCTGCITETVTAISQHLRD
jgi:hypothetical protein